MLGWTAGVSSAKGNLQLRVVVIVHLHYVRCLMLAYQLRWAVAGLQRAALHVEELLLAVVVGYGEYLFGIELLNSENFILVAVG